MSNRLILIRHGLTIWNHEFRYQGHTDIELSEEGVKQAQALQKRLAGEKLDAIYSSDLSRAVQTASIIAKPHRLELITDSRLREVNFGVWEGLNFKEIESRYPDLLKTWLEAPHNLEIPQGETFMAMHDRALTCIREIIAVKPSGTTAVVAHGGTIAALLCGLMNQPLTCMWNYKQKNAALNVLTVDKKGVTAEVINDVRHLQPD